MSSAPHFSGQLREAINYHYHGASMQGYGGTQFKVLDHKLPCALPQTQIRSISSRVVICDYWQQTLALLLCPSQ